MDTCALNMIPQAGNSSTSIVLGPPITPTTKMSAIPLEDNDFGLDDIRQFTPKPLNRSLPSAPPESSRTVRRSLDSSYSCHSTFSSHTNSYSNRTPPSHQRSASLSRESSYTSCNPNTEDDNRCRVSFDATPVQPSVAAFPSNYRQNSHSRRMSGGSFGQVQDENQERNDQEEADKQINFKKARFLEAPLISRSNLSASSDIRRSYMSAFNGEEEPELYAEEFRIPVDENIRSIPGVVGLGEGWAGGPQSKPKKKWYSRRTTVEEDPLSLWNEDKVISPNTSPLKGLWSKSKRNLFGQSSPALLDSTQGSEPPRSLSRIGRLFSMSRPNLTTTDQSPSGPRASSKPMKDMSKRSSLGIFSSSEITLHPNIPSTVIPSSPSMPILALAEPTTPIPRRHRQYSRSTLARSEGDSNSITDAIPIEASSPKRNSLRPPWRPSSMVITNRHSALVAADEGMGTSGSSTSIETPKSRESSCSPSSRGLALTRTATFGLNDIAAEQRIDEENASIEQELDDEWVQVRKGSSSSGLDSDKNKPLPRVPSPYRRPTTKQRKDSWLKRVKSALTASTSSSELSTLSETVDRLLPRRKSAKARKGSSEDYVADPIWCEPRMEPLKTSPIVPQRKSSRRSRRSSWMLRSSSSLSKRLSRLTEHEEGDDDRDLDIEEVDHANRLTASMDCRNLQENIERLDRQTPKRGKSFLGRRRSSNFSLLGIKSRRSSSVHPLDNVDGLPASVSMPTLSKLTAIDLNLHVDITGEGLGLEDILDEERRGSIVHSLGCMTPNLNNTREEVIQSTFDTLSAKSPDIKPKNHVNQGSPTTSSYRSKMKMRHNSLPLSTTTENHTRHRRTTTVSTINSSPSPSLITPRHPAELATFLNALTFMDADNGNEQERLENEIDLPTKANTKVGSAFDHNVVNDNLLHLPKSRKFSASTHRLSAESYLTQTSLYDTEEVVHGQAIRVESIGHFHKQASVISLEELGKNWSGGLQMTRS
ncbi:uncharacterized protein I206_100376 [Kwoniella pini CBS 10737]|uniref:Uncharacterized protein n=1 Tax=Kwoniella pini CBS 10737 TaxID=1296096 RepID=A0A1B9IDN5_9TREE|nr:uncharacterized protein I206_00949 [Kwoniella pini CBS 10737]OCF53643.1 hypothetical protein I206_00949 [Kwoniella pini CBS 10737]